MDNAVAGCVWDWLAWWDVWLFAVLNVAYIPRAAPANVPRTPMMAANLIARSFARASCKFKLNCSRNWRIPMRRSHSFSASMCFSVPAFHPACHCASLASDMPSSSSLDIPRNPSSNSELSSSLVISHHVTEASVLHSGAARVRVFEPGASRAIQRQWSGHGGCSAMSNVANQPELQQPASRSAAIRLLATLGLRVRRLKVTIGHSNALRSRPQPRIRRT